MKKLSLQQFARDWNDRLPIDQLCAKHGLTPMNAYQIRHRLKLPPRGDISRARLRILWLCKCPPAEIAIRLGTTVNTVRSYARRMGLGPQGTKHHDPNAEGSIAHAQKLLETLLEDSRQMGASTLEIADGDVPLERGDNQHGQGETTDSPTLETVRVLEHDPDLRLLLPDGPVVGGGATERETVPGG